MSLFGGAECSTSRNPLAQFTKHAGEDRSLQRPGFSNQSQQHGLREEHHMNQRDQQVCYIYGLYDYLCLNRERELSNNGHGNSRVHSSAADY